MKMRGLKYGQYDLEQSPFKQGGEGNIHAIKGNHSQIVKIYNDKADKRILEEKLTYMMNNQPDNGILTQIAWPLDIVYDQAGSFAGFVMNRLNITNTLNDVYVYPPNNNISFKNKLVIAQNICRIISEIHNAGYVFGDFNPLNIGVNLNDGTVAFLDTDSYHIVLSKTSGEAYRCNVCAPGYAAPELLAKCYEYISRHPEHAGNAYEKTPLDTFTVETDNFALGIHMFKLLNNGYSPYCGINSNPNKTASVASPGVGDEAVWKDNYCFKSNKMPISEAVLPVKAHPEYVAEMFTRTFVEGRKSPQRRPSAEEWQKALEKYEKELVVCRKNKAHMYKKGLADCPWCDADAKFKAKLNKNRLINPYKVVIPAPVAPSPVQTVTPAVPVQQNVSNIGSQSNNNTVNTNANRTNKGNSRLIPLTFNPLPADVFYIVGWIAFILSILYTILPMINDGSLSIAKEVLMPIDMIKNSVACTAGVFLLSFGSYYSGHYSADPSDQLSFVWGVLSCFINATIYYTQHGYNAKSASLTWKAFGILLLSYATAHYIGVKFGEIMEKHSSGKRLVLRINHRFSIPEIFLSIVMLVVCISNIYALMNLDFLYGIVNSTKYTIYFIAGIPAGLFVLYDKCKNHGKTIDACFCASMIGSLSVVMLLIPNYGWLWAMVGWGAMLFVLVSFSLFVDGYTE